MQTGKKAVESVKETAANLGASAVSGMDKTKAIVQEKMDKMRAKDDFEKGLATERKDDRITQAELRKERAQTHNLDQKEANIAAMTGAGDHSSPTPGTHSYSTTGVTGVGTDAHQMSALPGHETGQPVDGYVVGGTAVGSHPIGKGTGTDRSCTAENRCVGGGNTNTGLTGAEYSG